MKKNFIPSVTQLNTIHHYIEEGEKIQIGKELYEVIFTPGHSAELVCFYNKKKSVLLSTDHILPKITSNISYWFYGEQNPLHSYENSLNNIKKYNIDFVIFSLGSPFYGFFVRLYEIWVHRLDILALK